MSDLASVTMMLCAGLEQAEQKKVERLDRPIWETLHRAGYKVRMCQSRTDDSDYRWLDFYGADGVAASVPADEFFAASDADAVNLVAKSCA